MFQVHHSKDDIPYNQIFIISIKYLFIEANLSCYLFQLVLMLSSALEVTNEVNAP